MSFQEALAGALRLRIPRNHDFQSDRARIEALDTYMLESAWHQAELEAARLEIHESLFNLREAWDHLEGYEALKRSRTEAAVEDAKRKLRPDLYDSIQKARWMIARLSEQIERLERDAVKCSRSYTLKTGGG